jgi:hypothetical protein
MRQHRELDRDFLRPSRKVPCVRHLFACSPEMLWAALLDAESWLAWLPVTRVTWTSPPPFGVGTTRTVEGPSGVISETFHEWIEGRRMAFYFSESPLPVRAFGECYDVEPAPGGSMLAWRFRADANPLTRAALHFALRRAGKRGLPKLERFILRHRDRYAQ